MDEPKRPTETEERLIAKTDEIERRERAIADQQQEILSMDRQILENMTANKQENSLVSGLYRHRFWISLLLTVGVVLVWKAIDQLSSALPIVSTAVGALLVGLAILTLIDYLTAQRKK